MCTIGRCEDMEYPSLDPYEQQLLKVFDSYDFDNKGSLDKDGLTQLCCNLQLEEQGFDLIQHLLNDSNSSRVTFIEFKDALLTLLGSIQKSQNNETPDDTSPDREVSPKYVYGSKKYGRRTRPKDEDAVTNNNNNKSVQRSNSQSEVLLSKKRRTAKLKRCTSFPGSDDFDFHRMSDELANGFDSQDFTCTEEMLRQAWEKLGVGNDGFLNRNELVLVCDAIGLHRLADGVIRQLQVDANHRISFQELLVALQHDDTWSEVLDPALPAVGGTVVSHFPEDLKTVQHIALGPDGTGFVNVDVIAEMWENVGIGSPKLLLQELGFVCTQISVCELAVALEKEIKNLHESKGFANPQVVLLQAVLTLYRSEIRCLKNILEQMCAEREKLKNDVVHANNRATMLAQEVDDNHARMERTSQQQVKLLEQRHADVVKEITEQFSGEKDKIVHANHDLQQKILALEAEESQLRNDLHLAQEYSVTIDKENQKLNNQVVDLQQTKVALSEQLTILETDKHNYEYESRQSQIEPLLKQLSDLQIENSQLRDKNDEMLTEIESLNGQICLIKTKGSGTVFHSLDQSMEENVGVGLGSKRRSDDSPSKDLNILGLGDTSPRLGKVRKCHKSKSENLDVPLASSESGFDTELDALDSSLSISGLEYEEIGRLQARVLYLEDVLKQHSIVVPSANLSSLSEDTAVPNDMKLRQLSKRCVQLQDLIISVQNDLSKMLTENSDECNSECVKFAKRLNEKMTSAILDKDSEQPPSVELQDQIKKYVRENEDLVSKCAELENCIELLRTEYERCEDYWASKLDEERQMFEQEQNQSSDKLTELIGKIAEYEAQFAGQDEIDYRLPPIEEKYNLERQFTDLEQEFEEYKEHAEFQIAEKANEIADLREKLVELNQKGLCEVGVQATELNSLEDKLSNLSNCVIECTNLFSSDTMPFDVAKKNDESGPNSVDNTEVAQRDYVNPAFVWNKRSNTQIVESNSNNVNHDTWGASPQPFSIVSLPSTSAESASTITDNSTPSRLKKNRKHNKNSKVQRLITRDDSHRNYTVPNKQNSPFRWKTNNGEEMISLPISVLHNLNGRLHHLEQRCRHLQVVLKQQHYHAEQMLQRCWQQYRDEKTSLQYLLKNSQDELENQMRVCNDQLQRLAKTDVLVKDLYVENSYLVANVQRLEKQCHILTNFHSASSSM